jgi:hypothetical protein
MKMKAYASFDDYVDGQGTTNRAIIGVLRRLVKRTRPELTESVKWGNGCWLEGTGPVAYVYSARDHVQFGFFNGAALKDPAGLLVGSGKYVRHVKVRAKTDIDARAFGALLRQATRP